MKTGKFIKLGTYNNIKIGYGTIDFRNLKTIYLQLNSWVTTRNIEDADIIDKKVNFLRRKLKEEIYNLKSINFKSESIVDLDIKKCGLVNKRRSFMNLEITLYVNNHIDIKSTQNKKIIKELIEKLINKILIASNILDFYTTKNIK